MSFTDSNQQALPLGFDLGSIFSRDVELVLAGAADIPRGQGEVVLGDSRALDKREIGTFDRVVTSPPYVNRMSYIRELRPYMYWLGYIANGRDAGDLDWQAIGGTWGVATSRLVGWKPENDLHLSPKLAKIVREIASPSNKNGALLGNYISKYFFDMRTHFASLARVLNPGATIHYIIGNSTFYGVLLPAEEIFCETLRQLGYQSVNCTPLRKRNSKKELVEFEVRAVAP